MRAIVLPEYNANIIRAMKSLQVQELDIPEPKGRQVLIRVSAAPCNPSDIAFMRGGYNIRKPVPVVMGFECTGTIVETGDDEGALEMRGKRVSCFSQGMEQGTWAEYFMTDYKNCLSIRDEIDNEQAATFCINPFTAFALFRMAVQNKAGAIIQNGASGQVGIFIRNLAKLRQIPVINLVRKEEHITELSEEGEKHVLNLGNPDCEADLRKLALENHATIAFDAVAGDTSGMILGAMPPGSELIVYGGLSGKPVGMVLPLDIIFKAKVIRGFNLGDWKSAVGEDFYLKVSEELQDLIIRGILFTRIQGVFTFEQVQLAMEQYIRNMSSGKILFQP